MTDKKRPRWWWRMTDKMGLTDPGRPAPRMTARTAAFFAVLFSALAINWLVQAGLSGSGENRYFYLGCAVFFLAVGTGYLLVWKRARRRPPPSES
ncbi:hypothetical protein ABIB35_002552 [Arthrobacter sp. UYP6]|uniref:hypothetical protein n=1 Tax=Arthrobacter sp. UYP6 TaxID=1756378 RepID=UPI0033908838